MKLWKQNFANDDISECKVVVALTTVRLTDEHPGQVAADGVVAQESVLAEHRRLLDTLVDIEEKRARSFLQSLGVTRPPKVTPSASDRIFASLCSAAHPDAGIAEIYFLSLPRSREKGKHCLYAHFKHSSGYPYGVIVCKLRDSAFLAFSDGQIGRRLGIIDG